MKLRIQKELENSPEQVAMIHIFINIMRDTSLNDLYIDKVLHIFAKILTEEQEKTNDKK